MLKLAEKRLWILAASCVLLGIGSSPADTSRPGAAITDDAATRAKILRYVREKWGISNDVKIIVGPLQEFGNPNFYKVTITAESKNGKETHEAYVSKDRRYLVVGKAYALGSDPKNEIAQYIRDTFKLPPATSLTVGPFQESPVPHLLTTQITADDGKEKQTQDFYVTSDSRFLFLASVHNLNIDPKREVLRTISLQDQPSRGPENAPVTIVEYSDLQCASCGRFHEFLLHELLPKYGDKVRVVFKEFPLVSIHDWALTGSVACQCVYQLNPSVYAAYRTLIFQNQGLINTTNVRQQLLTFGEQVGVNRLQLATCLDAKVSLQRVEENFREGQALGVQSTPTSFINGRRMVGLPSPGEFYKTVDEALRPGR